jgi:hypothetical protein
MNINDHFKQRSHGVEYENRMCGLDDDFKEKSTFTPWIGRTEINI